MNRIQKKLMSVILGIGVLVLSAAHPAPAASLYEYYTTTPAETLTQETGDMGKQLATAFNQAKVTQRQQQIDFSEYYANLNKMLFYANKLSTYSDYRTDLQFARDKEVFKGLPEKIEEKQPNPHEGNKQFVNSKYEKMKKNVEEEIETYLDLIQISLDACESLSDNDLSGFLDNPKHLERIKKMKQEDVYLVFADKRTRLSAGWPTLASRIEAQFSLWTPLAMSPNAPIIDPGVTGAI